MTGAGIFISYRKGDTLGITGRIHDKLSAHYGADSVFRDIDNIPVGVDFREHLDSALEACDVLLVVIGPGWLGDGVDPSSNRLFDPADFVRLEIHAALSRKIVVVPLLVAGASMPSPTDLPPELESLAYRQAAIVDPGQDFHVHMDRLIAGLDQAMDGPHGGTGRLPATPSQNPIAPSGDVSANPAPPTLPLRRTNLIQKRHDPFLGRAPELAGLRKALVEDGCRLVTVTGLGGMGKTRLAVQFASTVLDEYPGGVWFADLSQVSTIVGLSEGVADSLGAELNVGTEEAGTTVAKILADRPPSLIILDNFETVQDLSDYENARSILANWLEVAPQIAFLVTSRVPLGLSDESLVRLKSLGFGSPATPPQEIPLLPAVAVFVERAKQVLPDFRLDEHNSQYVRRLCERLAGMPLAIRLVAGNAHLFSAQQMLEDDRSLLFEDGNPVSKAIAWSVEQLDTDDRHAFLQLGVFQGGWDIQAMESVVDVGASRPAGETVRILDRLIQRNLVEATVGSVRRFDVLEPVRDYLDARLEEMPAEARDQLDRRWASHFIDYAATRRIGSRAQVASLRPDLDNLLGVQARFIARREPELAGRAILGLAYLLELSGPADLRVPRLTDSVQAFGDTSHVVKAELLIELSRAWWARDDWNQAGIRAAQALDEGRRSGDPTVQANAELQLGLMQNCRGFLRRATRTLEAASTSFATVEDRVRQAECRRHLGSTLERLTGLEDALVEFNRAEDLLDEAGRLDGRSYALDRAMLANRRGIALWHHMRPTEALEQLQKAEDISVGEQNLLWPAAHRTNQALVLTDLGRPDEAEELFERSAREHSDNGHLAWSAVNAGGWGRALMERAPGDRPLLARAMRLLREAKGRAKEVYYPESIAMHSGDLARLHELRGDASAMYSEAREAVGLERTMEAVVDYRHLCHLVSFARAAELMGREDEAWEGYERARRLAAALELDGDSYISRVRHAIGVLDERCADVGMSGRRWAKPLPPPSSGILAKLNEDRARQLLRLVDQRREVGGYEYPWLGLEEWLRRSGEDHIKLLGYGSLLNLESATRTFPDLNEDLLTPVVGLGFRRVFDYDMPDKVRKRSHYSAASGRRVALLNGRATGLLTDAPNGVVFDIALDQLSSLRDREVGYDLHPVVCIPWNDPGGAPIDAWVLGCTNRKWEGRALSNEALLPLDGYLNTCMNGAREWGASFAQYFVRTTFLGDGITRLDTWLEGDRR